MLSSAHIVRTEPSHNTSFLNIDHAQIGISTVIWRASPLARQVCLGANKTARMRPDCDRPSPARETSKHSLHVLLACLFWHKGCTDHAPYVGLQRLKVVKHEPGLEVVAYHRAEHLGQDFLTLCEPDPLPEGVLGQAARPTCLLNSLAQLVQVVIDVEHDEYTTAGSKHPRNSAMAAAGSGTWYSMSTAITTEAEPSTRGRAAASQTATRAVGAACWVARSMPTYASTPSTNPWCPSSAELGQVRTVATADVEHHVLAPQVGQVHDRPWEVHSWALESVNGLPGAEVSFVAVLLSPKEPWSPIDGPPPRLEMLWHRASRAITAQPRQGRRVGSNAYGG